MAQGDYLKQAKAAQAARLKALRPTLVDSIEKLEKLAENDSLIGAAVVHARKILKATDEGIAELEKPLENEQ